MFLQKLIRNDNIIRIAPNETLSSALAKLTTSHDAAFLFSHDNKFLGVINPYYCLIKSSYPVNAKVEHCVYHPPKLRINYPIDKVAEAFVQSNIHYLPVFDNKERFMGIVSARYLLDSFQTHEMYKVTVNELLKSKNRPILTVNENDIIASAINKFKKSKFSKLVVVSKEMKLKGMLSYYDLITFLFTPRNPRLNGGEKDVTKTSSLHQKVSNFSKKFVLTVTLKETLNDVIRMILTKSIGSVVVIDSERKPIGIITTKDLLQFFVMRHRRAKIEIVSKNLSEKSKHIFWMFFRPFSNLINKNSDLSKTKLIVKEEKAGNLFKVILALFPKKGNPKVIHQEGKNLSKILPSLNEILKNITQKK